MYAGKGDKDWVYEVRDRGEEGLDIPPFGTMALILCILYGNFIDNI